MAIEKADDSSVIRDWARGGREIGRRLAAAGRSVTGVSYSYGTVQQVGTTGTLDVLIDGDDTVRRGLKMTTACRGAAAGDRVLVLKSGRLSTVTGVLAHDNDPYVSGEVAPGTILWSGAGSYMQEGQTARLSSPASACPEGIVLCWQGYLDGATTNTNRFYQHIHKTQVSFAGAGVSTGLMASASGDVFGSKYVYVYDDRVEGNAYNAEASMAGPGGITLTPRRWVLTRIVSY